MKYIYLLTSLLSALGFLGLVGFRAVTVRLDVRCYKKSWMEVAGILYEFIFGCILLCLPLLKYQKVCYVYNMLMLVIGWVSIVVLRLFPELQATNDSEMSFLGLGIICSGVNMLIMLGTSVQLWSYCKSIVTWIYFILLYFCIIKILFFKKNLKYFEGKLLVRIGMCLICFGTIIACNSYMFIEKISEYDKVVTAKKDVGTRFSHYILYYDDDTRDELGPDIAGADVGDTICIVTYKGGLGIQWKQRELKK